MRWRKIIRVPEWITPQDITNYGSEYLRVVGSTAAYAACTNYFFYQRWGAQLQVSKKVSDQLLDVHMADLRLGDIVWPAKSLEVVFEDPDIPSAIITCLTFDEMTEATGLQGKTDYPQDSRRLLITMGQKSDDGHWFHEFVHSTIDESQVERFLDTEKFPLDDPARNNLTDAEQAVTARLTRLILATLLYASVPRYRPARGFDKRMGVKPGTRNRPKGQPCWVLLPPVLHEHREPKGGTGRTVRTHYRRAHLRTLRSERFVNKRGEVVFIPQVLVHGEGLPEKPRFRVV